MGVSFTQHPNSMLPHSGSHGHTRVLYDPYDGANADFKKASQPHRGGDGYKDHAGRPRTGSITASRPRQGSYGQDRTYPAPVSGNRHTSYIGPRGAKMVNLKIVNDKINGCDENWIGPQNNRVVELYVNNLYDDVAEEEIKGMFTNMTGITPVRAIVKQSKPFDKPSYGNRSHAFVT